MEWNDWVSWVKRCTDHYIEQSHNLTPIVLEIAKPTWEQVEDTIIGLTIAIEMKKVKDEQEQTTG